MRVESLHSRAISVLIALLLSVVPCVALTVPLTTHGEVPCVELTVPLTTQGDVP